MTDLHTFNERYIYVYIYIYIYLYVYICKEFLLICCHHFYVAIIHVRQGWNSLDTIIAAEGLAMTLQSAENLKEAQELFER